MSLEDARSAGEAVLGDPEKICVKCACSVDCQYQDFTFPLEKPAGQDVADGAPEHAAKKPQQSLPGALG